MKIAVVGAGIVGTTIARRWQEAGHHVTFGVRNPVSESYRDLNAVASVHTIEEVLDSAEAVLLTIPGGALSDLLETHAGRLNGRLLLDATNNGSGNAYHQLDLFAERTPAAQVYRAFNTLGWENFAEPQFGGERADLFYSGPEGASRSTVERLVADVKLRPIYVGEGTAGADLLDGLTRLWFTLALRQGHGRHLAFRTLGLDQSIPDSIDSF